MAAHADPTLNDLTEVVRRDPKEAARKLLSHQKQSRSDAAQIAFLLAKVAKLEEEKRLARAERFGASSERGEPQYALFDEAEQHDEGQDDGADEPAVETTSIAAHERKRPTRKPLPADLPRVVLEHDPETTHCPCGAELTRIGTKTSEQLEVIPAQVYVIEHRRGTYTCPCCVDAVPQTAPMPAQPIPKSLAGPGLLAHIAVSKYADGLPLYRQSTMFDRIGVELPRQTLAGWMVRAGVLLTPLLERMSQQALRYDVLQMDETRVQVLKEDGKAAKSQSWMWVIRGGPPGRPVVRFHYDPGRGSSVPMALLDSYEGYLQTDGYSAYGAVLNDPKITGLGCWAHVRRKFTRAQTALPTGQRSEKLAEILGLIGKLYVLERAWDELTDAERQHRRDREARPVIGKIERWLTRQNPPPQSLLGKAVGYLRSEWPRLIVYLEDGRLRLDNNGVENAIRPFAVGRKNWLFSDTVHGAESSAVLYSVIETAKANGLNPYAYLKWLFREIPQNHHPLDAFLPWNADPEALERELLPPQL